MINIKKENNILVVELTLKRLDASMAVGFKDKMAELIREGNHIIVLNLETVQFIDSSGLGSIVSSLKMIGRSGDLVLCGVNDNIMSMFKITRMDRVFRIFHTESEAIQSTLK